MFVLRMIIFSLRGNSIGLCLCASAISNKSIISVISSFVMSNLLDDFWMKVWKLVFASLDKFIFLNTYSYCRIEFMMYATAFFISSRIFKISFLSLTSGIVT